jgi:NAD-dependent protein deacetylase/lipoamidase
MLRMSHGATLAALDAALVDRLRSRAPLAVLSGAGVSAESGLATFRGPGGLWEGRDPLTLATPDAFAADPLLVWRFYDWRRRCAAEAHPNAAHLALAAWQRELTDFTLITQNVDGLHERAGSRDVLRLHGTLWRLRCTAEGRELDDLREDLGPLPVRCACGALLRPGVVWFGEPLPHDVLERAERACSSASVVLVVGTSSLVYPAAGLAHRALAAGALVVEINPEPTPLSPFVHARLAGPAGSIVPRLAAAAGIAMDAR